MKKTANSGFAAVLVAVLGFLVLPLPGQEGAPAKEAVLTEDQVSAQLAAMEADAGISSEEKGIFQSRYKQAISLLKQAADHRRQAALYQESLKTAPGAIAAATEELAKLSAPGGDPQAKIEGRVDEIQKDFDKQQAVLYGLKDKQAEKQKALVDMDARPVIISGRIPALRDEIAAITRKLQLPDDGSDEKSPTSTAGRTLLIAQQAKSEAELEMLTQEERSQVVRQSLLRAETKLLARKIAVESKGLERLSIWLKDHLIRDARQMVSQADVAPDEIPVSDAAARALADEVRQLAVEYEQVVVQLSTVTAARANIGSRLESLTSEYSRIQEQLKIGGGGVAMAQILYALRNRLPSRYVTEVDSKSRKDTLEAMSLAEFQVGEKLRDQEAVELRYAGHSSPAVARVVANRAVVLAKLRDQYDELVRAQASVIGDELQYLNKIIEVKSFLEQQLFWKRSSPPLRKSTFYATVEGFIWLTRREHWDELWSAVGSHFHRRPISGWAALLGFAGLFMIRSRLRNALKQTGQSIRRVSTDRYRFTAEALLWTCVLALPAPLFFSYVGWALREVAQPSSWLRGTEKGLEVVIWMTWVIGFLAAACRKGGLGNAHFGWDKEPLALIRRSMLWVALVFIPALLLTSGSIFGDNLHYLDGAGRVSFMIGHLWVAFLTWRLLRFSDGVFAGVIREQPEHWAIRLRYVWCPLLIGAPLFIVVISSLGYLLSAVQLSLGYFSTMGVIIFGVTLYWVVLRWFLVKERKLAFAQALERRRQRQEVADSDEQDKESGDMLMLDPVDDQLVLRSISEQTRHLLQFLVGMVVAICIAILWDRALPIFSALGMVGVPGGFTLLAVLQGLLILVVTATAARNLPGVLELAVMQTTSIESGSRKSFLILFRYAVIAVGMAAFFGVLNLDWAKFSWIAAALSVGLGFGLQEVVSNFVCGLILLFEQPIRVGDVVTVDGVNGKVAKIRMRATTIMTWDRQEYVVPNKNIITGTLMNWTLSNPVSRVIVTVGVAYGSNTGRAMEIMEEVASNSDYVIEDPAPLATFEDFADSSLTLRLRAYLPNIDSRVQAVSELHSEIDRRFKEEGIEIPFPQRDLHLRSSDIPLGFAVQTDAK